MTHYIDRKNERVLCEFTCITPYYPKYHCSRNKSKKKVSSATRGLIQTPDMYSPHNSSFSSILYSTAPSMQSKILATQFAALHQQCNLIVHNNGTKWWHILVPVMIAWDKHILSDVIKCIPFSVMLRLYPYALTILESLLWDLVIHRQEREWEVRYIRLR